MFDSTPKRPLEPSNSETEYRGSCQRLETRGWDVVLNGIEFQFCKMKKFWKWTVQQSKRK